MIKTRKCGECGAVFTVPQLSQIKKYCSKKCAKKRANELNKKWRARNKDKVKLYNRNSQRKQTQTTGD